LLGAVAADPRQGALPLEHPGREDGGLGAVGRLSEPAQERVVVVRAGVDHASLGEVLGAIRVRRERELQDSHARQAEPVAQLVHGRRHLSQIFRQERQAAERLANTLEESGARPRLPMSVLRRLRIVGDGPVVHETDEVIEAHDIEAR
jgi:hypothetical protein